METGYLDNEVLKGAVKSFPATEKYGLASPFLACSFGPKNSGKTTALIKELIKQAKHKDIIKVHWISPSKTSNIKMINKIKCEIIFHEDIDSKDFSFLKEIDAERSRYVLFWDMLNREFDSLKEFKKYYKKVLKRKELEREMENGVNQINSDARARMKKILSIMKDEAEKEEEGEEDKFKEFQDDMINYVELYGIKRVYEKPLFEVLVFDDCQDSEVVHKTGDNPIFMMARKHRHILEDIWFIFHSVKDGLKKSLRVNISRDFFFKFKDDDTIKDIYQLSFAGVCTYPVFQEFFEKFFEDENNRFFQIDMDTNECRKNWGTIYHSPQEMILDILGIKNDEALKKNSKSSKRKRTEEKEQGNSEEDKRNKDYSSKRIKL